MALWFPVLGVWPSLAPVWGGEGGSQLSSSELMGPSLYHSKSPLSQVRRTPGTQWLHIAFNFLGQPPCCSWGLPLHL
jgi:hypothetical protein